jgi:16S rRNA (guanine1207-N2)-methyltransferase
MSVATVLEQFFEAQPERLKDVSKMALLRADCPLKMLRLAHTELFYIQTSKQKFDYLLAAGCNVSADFNSEFEAVVSFGTQDKEENLWNFSRSLTSLPPNGLFICAFPNELGASRYEKYLKATGLDCFSWSKGHCRIFGCRRPIELPEICNEWLRLGEPRLVPSTPLWSGPGMYGADKVDEGSALLSQCLPTSIQGKGADFGSGYGYLSWQVLEKCPGVQELHLFEDEKLGLDLSQKSLGHDKRCTFHWSNIEAGTGLEGLDFIIMNPPFHAGKAVKTSIAKHFIKEAAQSLRPGGELYLVANKQLSYEPTILSFFGTCKLMQQTKTFKVLHAII